MPHSPTDSTSTSSIKSSRHPKSWPSTTSPKSVSSTSSLSSLSSSTTTTEKPTPSDSPEDDDATALLNQPREKQAGQKGAIPNQARKKRDSTEKKGSKRHCIDFDWSYRNVCASSSTASGRKVVSGSALGGGRGGCGLM